MAKSVKHPILKHIAGLPAYQALLSGLEQGQHAKQARKGLGLPRAARLALLAALHLDLQAPIILVTNRADRALGLFDELNFWLPEHNNLYFPEPNPLFYEKLPWSESTRRDRLMVFAELSKYLLPGVNRPAIPPVIVTPVRAIMTRTLPRREFLRLTQRVTVNERRDLVEMTKAWVGLGYEYSNIVVQPGQFSRRGGILDVRSR